MKLHVLAEAGQAIWLDYIRRSFIGSDEMERLIDEGVRGMTSNPVIFERAIAGSTDYDDDLHALVDRDYSAQEIYEALALADIGRAADRLRALYELTDGIDGYVSLEVRPTLAHDTAGTLAEARRLFAVLNRPNVMIKVPATAAGITAVEELIAEGINVNVTLIFSPAQYQAVAAAYIAGLERLAACGGNLARVASVASFFVSRIDTVVDRLLDTLGRPELRGRAAIANAQVAYARFRETFSGPHWQRLAALGARVQRPLWASTGTKDAAYPDTLYVDGLIGRDTVNTVPPATLRAFLDHGRVATALDGDDRDARALFAGLAELGIDLETVTGELLAEGIDNFARSFETLMAGIDEKRARLLSGWRHREAALGAYGAAVDAALADMAEHRIAARIWAHDHTVWSPDPTEIADRLGWLTAAEAQLEDWPHLRELRETLHAEGYTHALLLGMGGSSLAPEVFRATFGVGERGLDLAVLDSTNPAAVLGCAERLDPARTLFIVSTKSGGTVETLSLFKFFYNRVVKALGAERAGEHFIAITDPGSALADTAAHCRFRAAFLNDPNIGGRYSALSHFGIVPAALAGVDVPRLLDRALRMAANCDGCVQAGDNPGVWLGGILGELARAGRDKVTLVPSPAIAGFGDWVEQLLAESTGKAGRGILPVVGEALLPPDAYADDRLFVQLRFHGDATHDAALNELEAAGHPVVRLYLHDPYDLGGQLFLWEMATAVAGHRLGVNPFDQPNVESAKAVAREMIAAYCRDGSLPALTPTLSEAGITVYGDVVGGSLHDVLRAFLAQAQPGDKRGGGRGYIALQAYVRPDAATDAALHALRTALQCRLRMATTVGYGPRFLHSTGQLHKGDSGRGLFIQLTAGSPCDAPIPDEAGAPASSLSFGVLQTAQALGDRRALLDAGRCLIRFDLGDDVPRGLARLMGVLA